jgi:hypothetical protein
MECTLRLSLTQNGYKFDPLVLALVLSIAVLILVREAMFFEYDYTYE